MDLRDTISAMQSADYKDRFRAEYWQTKIRYEKLRAMMNKWEAYKDYKYHSDNWDRGMKEVKDFLGFTPTCSYEILKKQLDTLAVLLETLEVRAVLEKVDLSYELLGIDKAE